MDRSWRALVPPTPPVDWRGEALTIALIVAESAIAYLYLGLLLPDKHPLYAPFPAWLIFALLTVAYLLPRLLDLNRFWGLQYEAALLVGLVATFLVTLKVAAFPDAAWLTTTWLRDTVNALILRPTSAARPVWGIVGVVAYAWWRGRTRAEPMLDAAYQMLRWGTLAAGIGLILILIAAPIQGLIRERMSPAIVVYFTAALIAIGVARLRLEGVRSGSPLGPRWFATFAAPIATIVLVAIVAAGLFSQRFLSTMLIILGPIFWVMGLIFRLFVILIALLAFVIIAPILWLLEREGFGRFVSSDRTPQLLRSFNDFRNFTLERLDVADPLRYLIAGLVLALIASALIRYVYRRRRRWRDTAAERRESVLTIDDALSGLTQPLRRLLRVPTRRGDSLSRLRGDPRWRHTVFIRETYRRLQGWGARAGATQEAAMTPGEYQPSLAERFPEAESAIRTIVAAYNAARYGPQPASAEEAEAVRQAWDVVRRLKAS